jgi:hypothetical protein
MFWTRGAVNRLGQVDGWLIPDGPEYGCQACNVVRGPGSRNRQLRAFRDAIPIVIPTRGYGPLRQCLWVRSPPRFTRADCPI